MGKYELPEIIKRWERGTLTTEQAIGQLLLVVEDLSRRVGDLEQRLEAWRSGRKGRP